MADVNESTRSDSAEDYLVLLEELIRSNQNVAARSRESLQRIEERLRDKEYVPHGGRHRCNP